MRYRSCVKLVDVPRNSIPDAIDYLEKRWDAGEIVPGEVVRSLYLLQDDGAELLSEIVVAQNERRRAGKSAQISQSPAAD